MTTSINGQLTKIETPRIPSTRKWIVNDVSSLNNAGGYISSATTRDGQIHLSYWTNQDTAAGQLFYTQQTGNEWSQEVVATVKGAQTAIAVTKGGQPLIAYFDLDRAQLMLARKSANTWETESVTPNEDDFLTSFAPGALCLAVDDQDQPVITYFNHDSLKLARPQDGGWGIETLASGPGAGFFHDLALDSQGNPVIACHLLGKQELHLLRRVDGAFADELVDATPNSGEYVSLALDANDQAHLCCWRATGLTYFTKSMNGGEWQSEQVDAEAGNQGLGLYCKIGVSRAGLLKVAYYDGHNGSLKFARRGQDGAWLVETVDDGGGESGDAGGYVALALNARDLAQIAYYDWGTQEVKFVQEPVAAGQGCLLLVAAFFKWLMQFRGRRPPRPRTTV